MEQKKIKVALSYRMPGEPSFYTLASAQPLQPLPQFNLDLNGFCFTNFDKQERFFIPNELFLQNDFFHLEDIKSTNSVLSVNKKDYLSQVKDIVNQINQGRFDKIVLSRIKCIEKPNNINPQDTFKALCDKYPNAFVYLLQSNEIGTWLGATPELLVKKENNTYHTVALAGTVTKDQDWSPKERAEQQIVTDYIVETLKEKVQNLNVSPTVDHVIGNIKHLKNSIDFELQNNDMLDAIVEELHPMPSVAGIPKLSAINYIQKLEHHNRMLYTGILGPLGINGHHHCFVNLRCMQILSNQIALYVGGGITADSIPEKEWQETENKAKILTDVLLTASVS